jgi:6-phosphofructokinase 1
VNTESIQYRIAREYMIRLDKEDLEHGPALDRLAASVRLTPEEFSERFRPVVCY